MKMNASRPIEILAPAKINLFLHVTGKRDNGYHNLESLISFADFGDKITIRPADSFTFEATNGDFEIDTKNNSIIHAANLVSNELKKPLNIAITLEKNIPIGAGLGGGSADAAATVHALLQFWEVLLPQDSLDRILLELGADTPACFTRKASYIRGIGEIITPIQTPLQLYAVLVYPNAFCSTVEIFQSFGNNYSPPADYPVTFEDQNSLHNLLAETGNDLTDAATSKIPEIKNAIELISKQSGCTLSRMSGSGSACFGLFNTQKESKEATDKIQKEKPHWWARPVVMS